jgi:hypothetical protein
VTHLQVPTSFLRLRDFDFLSFASAVDQDSDVARTYFPESRAMFVSVPEYLTVIEQNCYSDSCSNALGKLDEVT